MAYRHPLKGSEDRADQGLVLVDLRTRSMTQSRMPRVCIRRTAAGGLVARNSSIPRKRRPADANSDAGMTLDESTGLALMKAVAPGSDWLFSGPLRNLLSPPRFGGHRTPRGCRLGELLRRCNVPVMSCPIYQFRQSVLAFSRKALFCHASFSARCSP